MHSIGRQRFFTLYVTVTGQSAAGAAAGCRDTTTVLYVPIAA